jgi:hypothetical protein
MAGDASFRAKTCRDCNQAQGSSLREWRLSAAELGCTGLTWMSTCTPRRYFGAFTATACGWQRLDGGEDLQRALRRRKRRGRTANWAEDRGGIQPQAISDLGYSKCLPVVPDSNVMRAHPRTTEPRATAVVIRLGFIQLRIGFRYEEPQGILPTHTFCVMNVNLEPPRVNGEPDSRSLFPVFVPVGKVLLKSRVRRPHRLSYIAKSQVTLHWLTTNFPIADIPKQKPPAVG